MKAIHYKFAVIPGISSHRHSQCEKISLSRSAVLSHALDESRRSKFQRFSNLQVNFVIISLFHPHSALSFFFVPSPWRYIKQILVRFPSACELNRNLVAPLERTALSFLKNDNDRNEMRPREEKRVRK